MSWTTHVKHDLRYAWRSLIRTPAFTASAVATLALCLGANLAIFAVVDAVLLRPLPFPDAGRLVTIFNSYPRAGVMDDGSTATNYYERRGRIPAFDGIALYRDGAAIIGEPPSNEREFITRVTPDFFEVLGVKLALGRMFTEADTVYQADRSVVLTDAYWRQRFDGDPGAVGRSIRVNGITYTVVGVLPEEFSFLSSRTRVYLPLASPLDERSAARRHSGSSSRMIARLRPNAGIAEAQAQIDAHNAAVETSNPQAKFIADAGFHSVIAPLHASHVASIRATLLLVQAGVLLLLVIGAVNVANLMMIRASARVKETAVRQAIGASRGRLVLDVLVETIVLTLAGGVFGLAAGAAGIRLLSVLGTERLPLGAHVAFNARVAAVSLAGAVLLGVAIAVPIAWYHVRSGSRTSLNAEGRSVGAGAGVQRLRHAFLVAQVSLAFVLLSGAGLLAASLVQIRSMPAGFRPDHVLTGQVSLTSTNYRSGAARLAFIARLTDALAAETGVTAAGISTNVPFSGNSIKSAATVKGRPPRPGESPRGLYSYGVSGGYFGALGVSLLEGRFLNASDARACVVDEIFARRYWPDGGALGQLVFSGSREGRDDQAYTIVGVVSAARQAGLTETDLPGAIYYPYNDRFDSAIYVVVRTTLPPESIAGTLRQAVRAIDPELPVNNVRAMDVRIADSLITRRSPAVLAAVFSIMAVLLAAIGTYGVVSYSVEQRRREIAVRMAIGAQPADVRRQFLSVALRLLVTGTVIGVGGAWMTGRAMQTLLFNVTPLHVPTMLGAIGIITMVCFVACLLPSERASRMSPAEALNL